MLCVLTVKCQTGAEGVAKWQTVYLAYAGSSLKPSTTKQNKNKNDKVPYFIRVKLKAKRNYKL